jgi:gliding motility-associated-like protein
MAMAGCPGIDWATWTSINGGAGNANINTANGNVNVTLSADFALGSSNIFNVQKFNASPYAVPDRNVPQTTWAAPGGGAAEVCFSQKVTNPVLLIASLGSDATDSRATLSFSEPYIVIYDGGGMTYNNESTLTGYEGFAIILFPGEHDCIRVKSDHEEYYSNITVGIKPVNSPLAIDVPASTCGSTTLQAVGASPGSTYQWSSGDSPYSATNIVHESIYYLLTATDANGCTDYARRPIAMNNGGAPPAIISGNPNGCTSVTLAASAGQSFKWSGGLTPNNQENTFTASGKYSVLITYENGCQAYTTQVVTIAPPVAVIAGNNAGCAGVTLTASGGVSYLWDGGLTPNSATNTFNASGNYSVTVTDAGGCTAQASQLVTIGPPVATITGNTSGCVKVTLTAGGGVSYLWDGGNSPSTAANTFTVSGTYRVKVTGTDGCTSEASVTVAVGGPVASISQVISDCYTATLTASGGVSYQWDGGLTPNSATNTYVKNGDYKVSVTVKDANGCTSTISKDMHVGFNNFAADYKPISCDASEATAYGGVSYKWDGGLTPNSATNVFTKTGDYSVVITNADGCYAKLPLKVVVGAPIPLIVPDPAGGCDGITLIASGGQTYLWNGGNRPNSAVNTFTTSGRYKLTVINAVGCEASTLIDVEVPPTVTPAVSIAASPSGPVCAGTTISFTATGSNEGTNPLYEWYRNGTQVATGKTYSAADLKNTDEIVCKLTNSNQCAVPGTVTSEKFVAQINDKPEITFNQNLTITDDNPLQLSPTVTGNIIAYHWQPATGLSDATIRNPVANPAVTTIYRITVIPANGCESYEDVTVTVAKGIIIPNTFTPNGDGINDLWNVKYLADYPNARVDIYNRYGQPVYHALGYKKPWDGMQNGKPLPAGPYYYIIDLKVKNTPSQAGYITLLR